MSGAALVTNGSNLAKVARALDVPVRSFTLSNAKLVALPGEVLNVKIVKQGDQIGQGIGYLDDGTMVVVERASAQVGETVEVTVTNVLQTSNGQLIFGQLADEPPEELPAAGGAAS